MSKIFFYFSFLCVSTVNASREKLFFLTVIEIKMTAFLIKNRKRLVTIHHAGIKFSRTNFDIEISHQKKKKEGKHFCLLMIPVNN